MDEWRLRRRCKTLLDSLAGEGNVHYHRGWGHYINLTEGQCARMVGLFPNVSSDGAFLIVEFDPADTVRQARVMYRNVELSAVEQLLNEKGWRGWPNFHLMYMHSGFFRVGGKPPITEYLRTWAANTPLIRSWKRSEFEKAFSKLLELGVVDEDKRAEFDRGTIQTRREKVGMAPGVTIRWYLPLDEASVLDSRGRLEAEVRGAIERAASVLKLKLPW